MYSFDNLNINLDVNELANSFLVLLFVIMVIMIIIILFDLICNYKIFKKAGRDGWESLIPIYNTIVEFEFLDIPLWVLLFLLIPAINTIVVPIILKINLAKKFGKGIPFIVGLILFPSLFKAILAFDKDIVYDKLNLGIFEDNCSFCSNCGSKMKGNYCSNCGTKK